MSSTVRILDHLVDAGIEFIVVGMASAIAQGVPLNTLDLDIVHRRSPENVDRLLALLTSLDARTRYGIVDCLGVMTLDGADRGYEELLEHSITLRIDTRDVRLLSLSAYVRAKRAAGRPKDLAVLPVLEATLAELDKRRGG